MGRARRRKQLSNTPITTTVNHLSHEGRGIATVEGKTTFLFNALAGENVDFIYNKCFGQYDEGTATNIIDASSDRIQPQCPHYGTCGGCSLQHMAHPAQLSHKTATLLELLKHHGETTPREILPPIIGKPFGYRRKARIGVKYVPKKEKVLVGFRERKSPYVTNMNVCHTLHPEIGLSIDALSACLHELEAKASIPQCEIAMGDHDTAIIIRHLNPLSASDLQQLTDFFEQKGWKLFLQPKGIDSITLQYPKDGDEYLYYRLPNHQLTFAFRPWQFTQINSEINQQMIDLALDLLEIQHDDNVLDLFCGIGNFTLPIAKYAKSVIGVEGDEGAVNQAIENANTNGINNASFYTDNLFEPTTNATWFQNTYDKILLDPPRSGAKEILPYIKQWNPERLVYVSCNAATLARDTLTLKELGYALDKTGILDMFPQTQHAEAIALFIRKKHA